ncbi:MAG: HAD-IC family P-type ATPase, partial [Chloroflexota bacterium]
MSEQRNDGHEGHKRVLEHDDHPSRGHVSEHAAHDQREGHPDHHSAMVADFRRRFWVSLVLTVPVVILAPLIQDTFNYEVAFTGDRWAQLAFGAAIFFYGGWPFLTGLWDELTDRNPGMMTLISVAIGVAFIYSTGVVIGLEGDVFFWELATLVDVMLLGHWMEMRAVMGASSALEELVKLLPTETRRVNPDGSTEDVPVTEIRVGDRVQIRPGERVPTDGVVSEGSTSVDESMLTGESRPVYKGEGDTVIGGSVNGDATIIAEIQKTGEETYLSQVIETVREAQESKSRSQSLADRAARLLTVTAITVGFATLVAWIIVLDRDATFAIGRTVAVMVIACPHALGLAIPLVVSVSTTLSARNGLLIRDRTAFEQARELDAIVFDKTGTLTQGRFGVTDV